MMSSPNYSGSSGPQTKRPSPKGVTKVQGSGGLATHRTPGTLHDTKEVPANQPKTDRIK